MLPGLPVHDATDMSLLHTKRSGEIHLGFPGGVKSPDFQNIPFAKSGFPMIRSTFMWWRRIAENALRMFGVFGLGNYFKILKSVVSLDSVFMVHFKTFPKWADECGSNGAVIRHGFSIQENHEVSSAALIAGGF